VTFKYECLASFLIWAATTKNTAAVVVAVAVADVAGASAFVVPAAAPGVSFYLFLCPFSWP
jgi:hypothetical protein